MDSSFPAALRIKRRDEFQRTFRAGTVVADGVLVVHGVLADKGPTRLGISIAKRVGHAPLRNYWKRLIREAFRTQRHLLPEGLLLVVRPKKGAQPDYKAIRQSMLSLVRRLERKL